MASRKTTGRRVPAAKKSSTGASRPLKRAAKKSRSKKAAVEYEDGEESVGTEARAGGTLVIVESPAKAKTIGKDLGRGYKSEKHTAELQSPDQFRIRLLLEKKNTRHNTSHIRD